MLENTVIRCVILYKFEVLIAALLEIKFFWDVTLRLWVSSRRFEGSYRLNFSVKQSN